MLAAVSLKLISQHEIASCRVQPIGPGFGIVLTIGFRAKHRGHSSHLAAGVMAPSSTQHLPCAGNGGPGNRFLHNRRRELTLELVGTGRRVGALNVFRAHLIPVHCGKYGRVFRAPGRLLYRRHVVACA